MVMKKALQSWMLVERLILSFAACIQCRYLNAKYLAQYAEGIMRT